MGANYRARRASRDDAVDAWECWTAHDLHELEDQLDLWCEDERRLHAVRPVIGRRERADEVLAERTGLFVRRCTIPIPTHLAAGIAVELEPHESWAFPDPS
jgi:hypothetical protein